MKKANRKVKFIAVAAFFTTVSTFSFADDGVALGNEIDDSYYSELDVQNAQENYETARATIQKPYTVRIRHKGGYIATLGASWTTAEGERVSSVHPYVGVGQYREFQIKAGDSNVQVYATYTYIWPGNPIFDQWVTPSILDYNDPNLVEYHIWGTVFGPKWRLMY